MSAPLEAAVLLMSVGAAGAVLTSVTEVIRSWIRKHAKSSNKNQQDIRIVIRRGDDKLEITGKSGEEMLELINILIRQDPASPTPGSATHAENPDSDTTIDK